MDARMEKLAALLTAKGYTKTWIPEHWSNEWPARRWFSFEAPDSSILQFITANAYVRVTLMNDGLFRFSDYVSTEHPLKPKTEFFIDPFRQDLKTFGELVAFVKGLGTKQQQEAA